MRELLIDHKSSPSIKSNSRMTKLKAQKSITTILDGKSVSVELCPDREIDFELLSKLNVKFCSVTWLGNSKENFNTPNTIPAISLANHLGCLGYNVLLHITGRNLNRTEAEIILNYVKDVGIVNILALQGDPSQILEKDDSKCDFPYAADFVKFIKNEYKNIFCVGVAGYPQIHPNSINKHQDLLHLKNKVDAGADFVLTQACFSQDLFKNFALSCKSYNIHTPIIPGIFIINSYKSLLAMVTFCGVKVPNDILKNMETHKNDDNTNNTMYGIKLAQDLITSLFNEFTDIHIFTLNNLQSVNNVICNLSFTDQ
ncbi:uncharacterized protein LOC126265371 [Aethina tumida]|uniref:uncharacterized protein LOC126265371 n=1 Tax=Aethina tumida TaxID=116153 RepID=UPI0021476430|nr:uncharacterized protein LOC126265371 [Aethina tumida]